MKLLDWAQRKLLHKQKLNPVASRHCAGINNEKVPAKGFNADQEINIASNNGSEHVEILTIGTLGMGDVLSMHVNQDSEEPDNCGGDRDPTDNEYDSDGIQEDMEYIYEQDEEDNYGGEEDEDRQEDRKQGQKEEIVQMTKEELQEQVDQIYQTSLINCEPSIVNQYINPGSPTRASVSSINRASISSVDIQKLQEELQKILYFKLVPNSSNKSGNNTSSTNIDGKKNKKNKNKKNKKDGKSSSNISDNQVALKKNTSSGRSIHMQGSFGRGAFPLHNFLEIPMDALPPAAPFLQRNQWLLNSIRSKVLHCVSPKNIRLPHFLADKLVKSKARTAAGSIDHQPGGGKIDKMMHVLRKMQGSKTAAAAAATAAARRRVSSSCRKSIGDGSQRHQYAAGDDDTDAEEDAAIYGDGFRKMRRQDSSERFIQYMNKMAEHQQQQQEAAAAAAAAASAASRNSSISSSSAATLRSSTSSTTSTASTSTTLTADSSSSATSSTVTVNAEVGTNNKNINDDKDNDNEISANSPSSSPSASPTSSCSSDIDGTNPGRRRSCRHRHRRHRRHADVGGIMGCWINTDDEYLVLEL